MISQPLLRALIVDDEKPARDLLVSLLRGDPEVEVVGSCGNGHDALAVIARETIDLLFLDVQMPGLSGFEVVRRLTGDHPPHVVFVTAHDEFAVSAFEVHALDYLLKPFPKQRLQETLRRAKSRFQTEAWSDQSRRLSALMGASGPERPGTFIERFKVQTGTRLLVIPVERISYLESADHYTRLHSEGSSHLVLRTMASLEGDLDPAVFVRIHRTKIINTKWVAGVRAVSGAHDVELKDGSRHRVSRSRKDAVDRLLQRTA